MNALMLFVDDERNVVGRSEAKISVLTDYFIGFRSSKCNFILKRSGCDDGTSARKKTLCKAEPPTTEQQFVVNEIIKSPPN